MNSPWLTSQEGAERARGGVKLIYREVKAGRLRSARIGGRRELRFLAEWIDDWLIATSTAPETASEGERRAVRRFAGR